MPALQRMKSCFAKKLTDGMTPAIKKELDTEPEYIAIAGYSLAGLFALWSVYNTDMFDAVSAASPSVWFPGWMDYIYDSHYKCNTIYLSMGDKEEKAKNPVMAAVGDNIRAMAEYYGKITGLNSVLEWNQGNHFRDADIRTAKGFVWTVNTVMNKNMNKDMKG